MKILIKNAIPIILVSLFVGLSSCEDPVIPAGSDADFTHFEFAYMLDTPLIVREKKEIYAKISDIADVTNLIPTFVLTQGATAYINNIIQKSGISENDFSRIVEYTLVSENGKTKNIWRVIIEQIVEPPPNSTDLEFNKNATIPRGIYKINGNIKIADGVYVSVQPGATFILGKNSKFIVGNNAYFIARGTEDSSIIFTSEADNWDGFVFNSTYEVEFHFCKIENAGYPGSQLMQLNNSTIGVINCEIDNINSTGFLLDNTSNFRIFDYNKLTNIGTDVGYPIIFSSINSVSNLGDNNVIETERGILIKDGTVRNSITLRGQTRPYIFESDIICEAADATFFIRNGVVIQMNFDKEITVGNTKMVFKIEGTEADPVIIKGSENTAGFWRGISINGNILAGSNLAHCKIFDAGNGSSTGAIKCNKTDISRLSIQNCTISNTNSHGIYFTKDSKANLDSNTIKFENIPSAYKNIFYE